MQKKGFLGFFKYIFGGFVILYWMFITGIPSILGYVYIPNGITLDRPSLAILTIIIFTLIFLCSWLIYQGWQVYHTSFAQNDLPKIVDFLRSDNYGEEFVFLVENESNINSGKIAELRRYSHGVEVSFALIEFMEKNSKGQFQAKHIWFSPGHLRELKLNCFSVSEITVDLNVNINTLNKYMEELK
ncbi:hypothetical protein Metbo_1111 [Methanobacterium lacus]|uniref:Uncharacterized protein n=1 Tax=Methanobacterium lacus (strain AL-21) TaxID=877455 RepID=F0T5W3_METLA|nr:hypothetical protein [Methanobacterium lacus]ADZ09356.1 hypothetical protein Metbo_1111 [Methanobacterium lacus]